MSASDETLGQRGKYMPGWDWRTTYENIAMNGDETLRAMERLATLTPDQLAEARRIADTVWSDRKLHPHRFYVVINYDTQRRHGEILDQPELALGFERAYPDAESIPAWVYVDLPEPVAYGAAYFLQYGDHSTLTNLTA